MARFSANLRSLINSTTSITSLVSSRIHHNHIPQSSAFPHIWYRIASDVEEFTQDGIGGLHEFTADIECVSDTEASVQNVADAVRKKLDGYKGAAGTGRIHGSWVRDKSDDYVPFSIQADDGVSLVALDLRGFYTT